MTRSSIRRIVVTSDVTRPHPDCAGEGATRPNARWLHALLAWPLSQVCDLPVEVVYWGAGFDAARFYRHLDAKADLHHWARVHHATALPPAAEAQILETYSDSLVIGYEMAPSMLAVLHRAGIPVLDMGPGPLRFLEDLLCCWRTNRADVHERLCTHRFDEQLAHQQAGLLRAKMAWAYLPELPDGTALIVGQVGSDKAMIHKPTGRVLSLADYTEELFQIAERHPNVLYKPHPYQDRHGASAAVMARFKSFRSTQANVYQLMCQPGLQAVYAISSGCVAEAPYFGKEGHYLYEPVHVPRAEGRDAHGLWNLVPVGQEWLSPAFWRNVLAPVVPVRPGPPDALPYRANRIRRALNADWGYMAVDAVVANPSPQGL